LVGGFLLLWLIPYFWLGFLLLLGTYIGPLAAYIVNRNARAEPHQQVLTKAHLRFLLAEILGKVGIKISAEPLGPDEVGPPLKLLARGATSDVENNVRVQKSRQAPGLREAREIIAAGLAVRATSILLDVVGPQVAMRYVVDGVRLDREPLPREKVEPAVANLKILCGLNPNERQRRQEGTFVADYAGTKYASTFIGQGIQGGERVAIQFEETRVSFVNLAQLGMSLQIQEQLQQLLNRPRGLVICSAPPGGGLRTTVHAMLYSMDRFLREFVALEDENNRYPEIENIKVVTYNGPAGRPLDKVLTKVLREEPNVLVVRDLPTGAAMSVLCGAASTERLVVGTVRATDCAEAMRRLLALGVSAEELTKALTAVLNQRLVRRLCEACKEPFPPPPEMLKQLGLPSGRIEKLFRPPTPPKAGEKKKPCPDCGGIGYKGRTALYELVIVGDNARKALIEGGTAEQLRAAIRRDGARTIREEGLLLVVNGITTVQELARGLKV